MKQDLEKALKKEQEAFNVVSEALAKADQQYGVCSEKFSILLNLSVRISKKMEDIIEHLKQLEVLEEFVPHKDIPLGEGWIHWSGGVCPLKEKESAEVMFRNGNTRYETTVSWWNWEWNVAYTGGAYDIIAYRVTTVSQEKQTFLDKINSRSNR